MRFARGTYRFVLAIPRIGIVLKFPIIRIPTPSNIKAAIRDRKFLQQLTIETSAYLTVTMQLFRGIYENFNEWRYWVKKRHVLCQPTYFSFFGLINIQAYGDPTKAHKLPIWPTLCKIAPENDTLLDRDSHHFTGENFCFGPQGLKMFDYGLKKTQAIIDAYGVELQKEFSSHKAD